MPVTINPSHRCPRLGLGHSTAHRHKPFLRCHRLRRPTRRIELFSLAIAAKRATVSIYVISINFLFLFHSQRGLQRQESGGSGRAEVYTNINHERNKAHEKIVLSFGPTSTAAHDSSVAV